LIDLLTLVLTHGLILIALLRLLRREDLDEEGAARPARPLNRKARTALDRQGDD